jgi:Golgi apparatus protein 1
MSLGWGCKGELFRQELEESDDLRLSLSLLKACHADKKQVPVGRQQHVCS